MKGNFSHYTDYALEHWARQYRERASDMQNVLDTRRAAAGQKAANAEKPRAETGSMVGQTQFGSDPTHYGSNFAGPDAARLQVLSERVDTLARVVDALDRTDCQDGQRLGALEEKVASILSQETAVSEWGKGIEKALERIDWHLTNHHERLKFRATETDRMWRAIEYIDSMRERATIRNRIWRLRCWWDQRRYNAQRAWIQFRDDVRSLFGGRDG